MIHSHPVVDTDKHFIIDPITRAVTNAESKKTLLMQNDHNSERFSFEIDKLVEGHDLTLCNRVEVHYSNVDSTKKNKSQGVYEVDDLDVSSEDENKLVFTWLVSQNATIHPGSLSFLIVFSCVENGETTYRWNTNLNNSISIAKGMNNGEAIEESYPDILVQWKRSLFAAMHGMETIAVGPTEPSSYPYIWFDTSNYTDGEEAIGVLTIKDAEGNKQILYPYSLLKATDGASITDKLDEQTKQVETLIETVNTDLKSAKESITNLTNNKVDKEKIANNLTTVEEGYVLDARQGYELKRITDTKATTAEYSATLLAANWSDTEPYTQTVAVDGILFSDDPFVDISLTDVTDSTIVSEFWSFVYLITTDNGSITAYCREEKPTVDMTINLKVVR